ncbi:MAG TPA: hypothetical protein VKH44_15305, partial [Pirellulaceae bacterium]|nr:hypothetical protein [Pirellulaceae bacterium]
ALQFESADAKCWGSPQLTGAVVEYVAAAAPTINVFQGFDRRQMVRRLGLLAACLAVVMLATAMAPRHLAAFFNRLCLGSMHYPTQTRIDQIVVNGTSVFSGENAAAAPADCKAAQGRPLTFLVTCSGQLPSTGSIVLTAASAVHSRTRLELRPLSLPAEGGNTVVLIGELARLSEDVTFKVAAGDAWTEPALIRMIPLPIVELQVTPRPPKYAAARAEKTDASGRQFAVLEGSAVEMTVESANRKPLASAWLTLQKGGVSQRIDLVPRDSNRYVWSPAAAETALKDIRQELRYEIQVVDADGLSLESPIRGTIRIRPDQPPTGLAEVIHKVVLPAAEPLIAYRASDDYGISRLALVVDVERGGIKALAPTASDDTSTADSRIASPAAALPTESHRYEILAPKEPLTSERLPMAGSYALSLSPLKLTKGDRIKLTLEVTDYRGENDEGPVAGQIALSDSLALEISDESGVLAAISQADQRSEQQLSEIIKRQLGIEEEPK